MECKDVLERVEATAAGDLDPDAASRAHLESCTRCAAALASARRLEALLAARPAPAAPPRFTASVIQRIRRERWRAEQQVDRLFNAAIAIAVVLVAGGVLAMLNLNTLLSFTAQGLALIREQGSDMARDSAPAFGSYVAAAGLLVSATAMWLWAERKLQL